MKRSSLVVGLVVILTALAATTAALAAGPQDKSHGNTLYRYVGQVQAKSTATVTVAVQNGNNAALRSLLQQPQVQEFAVDSKTVFLKWANGIPTVVSLNDVAVNDYVAVNVRADRGATIDQVKAKPAATVGDRGPNPAKPGKPLYLFRGVLVSTPDGKVTIDVKGGNRPALRLLLGAQGPQTFTTGPETVFLHWAQRIPTVIAAKDLKPGDRIVIRVRADRGSNLAQVEATAAKRVADREPKGEEQHQNAQA